MLAQHSLFLSQTNRQGCNRLPSRHQPRDERASHAMALAPGAKPSYALYWVGAGSTAKILPVISAENSKANLILLSFSLQAIIYFLICFIKFANYAAAVYAFI